MNGWISNLTKNTASARINFAVTFTDAEIESFTMKLLFEELERKGRKSEATVEQWQLKEPIKREYPMAGKSSSRIRLVRITK